MAKKQKNTARKTVGGSAKRIHFVHVPDHLLRSRSSSRSPAISSATTTPTVDQPASPQPMDLDREDSELPGDDVCFFPLTSKTYLNCLQWCAMCFDGHDLLVTCSRCRSVNCASCVPGLAQVSSEDLGTYTYSCVGCCNRGETFFVRYYSLSTNCVLLTPSQGLFHSDGRPVFQEGMALASHNITPTIRNRLRTPRLVIIEFVLDSLHDVGSAGQMLYLSLAPNYVGSNRKNIHHECIRFDLKNKKAFRTQLVSVKRKLRKLQKYLTPSLLHPCYNVLTPLASRNSFDHAVVIIHTHSDDTTGDLFITPRDDDEKTPLAFTIKDVSSLLGMHYKADGSWSVFHGCCW